MTFSPEVCHELDCPIYTADYHRFLAHGGTLRLTVPKDLVAPTRDYEAHSDIAGRLHEGLELPPTPLMRDRRAADEILIYGEAWAPVVMTIYRFGGRIKYRELSPTDYEATLELPAVWLG